jgi:hypothetical protein
MSDNHTTRGTMQDQLTRIVTYLRHGRRVSPHIVIGPIVWQPKDDGRLWYFVVATRDGPRTRFDQLGSPQKELAEELQSALFVSLIHERSIVIHSMDDELQMARLCEVLWPSAKTRTIRANSAAERAAGGWR